MQSWDLKGVDVRAHQPEILSSAGDARAPEAALTQALELYALGRSAAGLQPDRQPRASLSG
jgi:hypothetical protein